MTARTEVDARQALTERLVDATPTRGDTKYLGLELGLYQALADLETATEAEVAGHADVALPAAPASGSAAGRRRLPGLRRPDPAAGERRYRLPRPCRGAAGRRQPYRGDSRASSRALAGVFTAAAGGLPHRRWRPLRRLRAAGCGDMPRSTGRCSSTRWPAAGYPPYRRWTGGCGRPDCSTWAAASAPPRSRSPAPTHAQVLGVDLDQASVTEAWTQAADAGVADRVTFLVGDAAHAAAEALFDLVTIFEALHDEGDPVGTLRTARGLLADDGRILVADERVADAFTAPGDPTERFMYGWSILHCLPATLAEHPVEASGTVLRTPTVARWAATAGFTGFEVLPIDNPAVALLPNVRLRRIGHARTPRTTAVTRPRRGPRGRASASMAGLLAARVLADAYAHVTVIDRDQLPQAGSHGVASPRAGTCTRCWLAASRPWRSCCPGSPPTGRPRGADRGRAGQRPLVPQWPPTARPNPYRAGRPAPADLPGGPRARPGAGPAQPAVPGRLRPPRAGHDARGWPRHRDAGCAVGSRAAPRNCSRRPGGRRHRPRLPRPTWLEALGYPRLPTEQETMDGAVPRTYERRRRPASTWGCWTPTPTHPGAARCCWWRVAGGW